MSTDNALGVVVMVVLIGPLFGTIVWLAICDLDLHLPRRRSRHQRTLDHIAQLERELGIVEDDSSFRTPVMSNYRQPLRSLDDIRVLYGDYERR